ncbi:DUF443 family protein [Lactobacillus sp. YT155]|uniref:DUF443 family protein n=1 Tax=Lactobacillus sp. YT155 TaxID=3060955 RepID=UPI00265F3D35|nr:DUF443 family protein [Lactobacillus sp. YT155]MDO1604816.1 DUF443 family protein [Lactobacillus sp. YT155]
MTEIEVQSEPLTGNKRYMILNTANKHYLVDVNRPYFLLQLFPFLILFIKHRCYEITPKQWNELSGPLTSQNRQWTTGETITYTAAAMFIFPSQFIVRYFDGFNINGRVSQFVAFVCGIIGLVILRYYSIHKNKLDDSYLNEKKMVYAKIRYSSTDFTKSLFRFIFITLVISLVIAGKIADVKGSILLTVLTLVWIYIYSIMNEHFWTWKWSEETYLEIDD